MSTEEALLRVIRDMPDEDTPRLAYADYLDEEGGASNGARAELIRLQIARAQLPQYDPRRYPLEDREHELLAEHEYSWLGADPTDMDELTEWEFERGFVEEVAASPFFMRVPGAGLCRAHPVRRWRVQSGQDNMVEDLRDAGPRGWFSRLRALDLAGWFTTIGELNSFFWNADFSHLRELDLTDRPGLNDLPHVLTDTPLREQLKVLRCGRGGMYGEGGRLDGALLAAALGPNARLEELGVASTLLTADDLRDLLIADCCRALTSLDISNNQIAPDGWDAFRFARARLRELDISSTPLGAIAFDRLHELPSLSTLSRLHMNGCGSAMANMRALAKSRYWQQAEELRMRQGTIPDASLEPLFSTTGPRGLRILDVAENFVRNGVAQLCDAPWAGSITYLDLSSNYLTDDALRTLAKSGRFKNLHTLHLNYNSPHHQDGAAPHERVTDSGLRALAECPDLANLRVFSVSGTQVTAAGVDALLNGPHWRLTALSLSQCHLGSGVMDVLASSPRLARLEVLDLSHNPDLDDGALGELAETEHLSSRTELDVRRGYGGIGASVLHALRQRLGRRLSD